MRRTSIATLVALFATSHVAAMAQPGPNDAASDHAAQHQAAKEDKKADLGSARSSTAPPQNTAANLLEKGYLHAGFRRYRTQLLTSPGNPLKVDGQFVYIAAPFNPDNMRASMYVQLLRMIGKANLPPSAARIAKMQQKAAATLVAATTARAIGQPVVGKHQAAAAGAAGTTGPTITSNGSGGLIISGPSEDLSTLLVPPTSNAADPLAVQSVDGLAVFTTVPLGTFIGTSFNAPQIDYNDPGMCASGTSTNSAAYRDAILKCFAHAVHNLRVQAAQDAVSEYEKWKRDPYGFTPPSGFSYSAPARPVTDGHGRSLNVGSLYSTDASSAPDVRMFGEADAVNAFVGGDAGRTIANTMLALFKTSNSSDMPALRAAMGEPPTPDPMKQLADIASGSDVYNKIKSLIGNDSGAGDAAGDAAGGLAGAGLMSSESVYNAVMPYASKGFWNAAEKAFTGGVTADEAEAGPPGLLAAFITTMIEAGVDEGQKVFGNKSLPSDLQNELAAAKSAPDPSAADLAGSQSGRSELFTVFVGGVQSLKL